jgi:hypothetical protein
MCVATSTARGFVAANPSNRDRVELVVAIDEFAEMLLPVHLDRTVVFVEERAQAASAEHLKKITGGRSGSVRSILGLLFK